MVLLFLLFYSYNHYCSVVVLIIKRISLSLYFTYLFYYIATQSKSSLFMHVLTVMSLLHKVLMVRFLLQLLTLHVSYNVIEITMLLLLFVVIFSDVAFTIIVSTYW